MTPRHLLTAALWLGVLACGAFALGSTLLAPAPAGAQGQPITVEMGERGNEYFFAPNQLSASVGTVNFVFRNAGSRQHNFVIEALNLRTPDIPAGATREASFTFTTPGTYVYICDLPTHAQRGHDRADRDHRRRRGPAAQPTAAQPTAAQRPGGAAAARDRPGHGRHAGHGHPPGPGHRPPHHRERRPPARPPAACPCSSPWPSTSRRRWPGWGWCCTRPWWRPSPYLSVAQRADLLRRPRWLILAVIPLFGITGTYQTIYNPFVTITDFETAEAFRATSAYAQALFWKHGFVLLSMALTLAVTFWLAPRMAQSAAARGHRRRRRPGPGPRRSPSTAGRGSALPGRPAPDASPCWPGPTSPPAWPCCCASR